MEGISDTISSLSGSGFSLSGLSGSKPQNFTPALNFTIKTSSGGSPLVLNPQGVQIYKAKVSGLGDKLTLRSDFEGDAEIGHVKFHTFSSKIDVDIRGFSMQLKKEGSSKYTFQSPAYPGATRTWRNEGKLSGSGKDFHCIDERGVTLARFLFSTSSLSKMGQVQLAAEVAQGGPATEELVLTAIALAQDKMDKAIIKAVSGIS